MGSDGGNASDLAPEPRAVVMKRPAAAKTALARDIEEIETMKKSLDCEDAEVAVVDDGLAKWQIPEWMSKKVLKCRKCLKELPDQGVTDLPKGWVAQGRNKDHLKCGACNTLCVQIRRTGMSVKDLATLSPIEISSFFVRAKGWGGKKLKEANCMLM